MKKIKNGMIALGLYCLLVGLAFLITSGVDKTTAQVIYIIVLVLGLLIWYESMYTDLRKGLLQGTSTMLCFVIPSLVLSIGYYLQIADHESWKTLYFFFHSPFIYGLNSVINIPDRPIMSIILPSGIIVIFFLFLLIKHIIRENNWQKSPYIY